MAIINKVHSARAYRPWARLSSGPITVVAINVRGASVYLTPYRFASEPTGEPCRPFCSICTSYLSPDVSCAQCIKKL